MRAIGGVCTSLATLGTTLLNGRLHIAAVTDNSLTWYLPGGQVSKQGAGANGWLFIHKSWTSNHYDAQHAEVFASGLRRTLQSTLAHELDHLEGREHVPNTGGYVTPNQLKCDDT
jgi:hypothetical protein